MKNTVFPSLPMIRLRLRFAPPKTSCLVPFAGNAWRGALGHALKSLVCVTREPQCQDCALYRSCAFAYLWMTPPPVDASVMRLYAQAPHPYVLAVDDAQPQIVYLTLFGKAGQYAPLMVHALARAGQGQQGIAGQRFVLEAVEQASEPAVDATAPVSWHDVVVNRQVRCSAAQSPAIPPVPESCAVHLVSPLRVKRDGDHLCAAQLQFRDLFSHLLRRISMLMQFHADCELAVDFRALLNAAAALNASMDVNDVTQTRYSRIQQQGMKMRGAVGRALLQGSELPELWPYLWLGQFTHAGSGATMGMGRLRVEPLVPLASSSLPFPQAVPESH